ncbi:MAG: hypothetical protein U0559_00510 [Anaerolineae bacterium]
MKDPELTDIGHQQANNWRAYRTGDRNFQPLGATMPIGLALVFCYLYTSLMIRAVSTARPY